MKRLVAALVAALLLAPASLYAEEPGKTPPGEKVQVAEGWYRVEPEGSHEEPLAVILVPDDERKPAAKESRVQLVQSAPPANTPPATPSTPPPAVPPREIRPLTPREEVELFQRPDCEEVRGKYLERLLELHGLSAGQLPTRSRDLAVWTRNRRGDGPPTYAQIPWPLLGDPALAPLYAIPPLPPGAIAWDFTLRNLAGDLLKCEQMDQPQPPTKYPRPQELLDQPVQPDRGATTESQIPATPQDT